MNTRAAAARIIGQLLRQQGSLATLLPHWQDSVAEGDRALLRELCYGTARWQPRLQAYLSLLLKKPLRNKDSDVQGLLLVGLYQLLYMRTPDHAALDTTVEAVAALKKPWAKGLINGVLRRLLRERTELEEQLAGRPEFESAHPAWLHKSISQAWPVQADWILAADNQHPPFTLRVNRRAIDRTAYCEQLENAGIQGLPTPHSAVGVTLTEAMPVEQLPHFAEGWVSVQDEAPQLTPSLMALEPGLQVLDACCAPGGKTAHLLETQPDLERLVALDIHRDRLALTAKTLERLGLQADLCAGDASDPSSWWDGKPFDRILLDAPCSATGIVRRQPDIKILRTPAQVKKLVATQGKLLSSLWPLLKPGGLLLYATCSILPEENRQVIARFLEATPSARHEPIEAGWGEPQDQGRQLLPQPNGHDGFYYAVLRKEQ